jgi:hypothetical protein
LVSVKDGSPKHVRSLKTGVFEEERIATPNPSVTGANAGDTSPFRGGKAHWLAMTCFVVCLHMTAPAEAGAVFCFMSIFSAQASFSQINLCFS